MAPAELDHQAQQWVLAQVGAQRVVSVTGLRAGGSPWLVQYETSDGAGSAVVRVGEPGAAGEQDREVRGIRLAAAGGVPVADVIATRADENATMLLIQYVQGSSVQPADLDPARPATLGAIAARISKVPVDGVALPAVTHPIPGVDFDELRRQSPPQPLLVTAQERLAAIVPDDRVGFVHGDLWSGNTLWRGSELAAVIDWDCAGVGPAGVDLGSLRCDAAMCYGLPAADLVLDGWERAAGEPAPSVAYWDVVAALSTPPEIDWFAAAISGMTGRPDLTKNLLRARRDEFLADALDRLG
jgi:aminoglycoside phosphotransferase (APT) family kinase protein